MAEQEILGADEHYTELDRYIMQHRLKKVFLVCGRSIHALRLDGYFQALPCRLGVEVVRFSGFQPNPQYESVAEGVRLFCSSGCDSIVAVGGGSAIDVAKCVKLYCHMDPGVNYLTETIIPNRIPFLAVPTTAGTGSEATRYAVIYYEGEKQSVADASCVPSSVLFDESTLKTLPEYQRKAPMLDALCHAVESFWSVNSTEESRRYSAEAISQILFYEDAYLKNERAGNAGMLKAANTAGKAINITQTTAGHAMCYKLTSLYGIAHGHAAALCVSALFSHMVQRNARCIDPRGEAYLADILRQLARAMGCGTPAEAAEKFRCIVAGLGLEPPRAEAVDYVLLEESVNPVRLKNHPVYLGRETIDRIYHQILA